MKRAIALSAVVAGLLIPATASAGGAYSGPGYDQAIGNTPCADHGAFGYFGQQGEVHDLGINNLGSNGAPGADGAKTGDSNSHLCGNPQN
jgi:hypothetical protein